MKSLLFEAVICLQLSTLLLAAPAAEQKTLPECADQTLSITVDNKLLELYIDGNPVARPPNANQWSQVDTVSVPASARVIAVRGEDTGFFAGILASGSNFVSDGSWKCSRTFSSGWQEKSFDDSSWEAATVIGKHGVIPWLRVAGIRKDAYWIWTNRYIYNLFSDKIVYCRKTLPACSNCASTGSACITSCNDREDGDYQSCNGCDVYATCTNHILIDNRPCAASGLPDPLQWDDTLKRCEWTSTTCKKCGGSNNNPTPCSGVGTGPRCITSCANKANGDYQSCHGCHEYASCSEGNLVDNRPCPLNADGGRLVWDDDSKTCEYTSPTCNCE